MQRPRNGLLASLILMLTGVIAGSCARPILYLNETGEGQQESEVAYLSVENARDRGLHIRQIDTCHVAEADMIAVVPGAHTITFYCKLNIRQLFSDNPNIHSSGTAHYLTERYSGRTQWGRGGGGDSFTEIESTRDQTIEWVARAGRTYRFVGEVRVLPQRFLESLKWEWGGHIEEIVEKQNDG